MQTSYGIYLFISWELMSLFYLMWQVKKKTAIHNYSACLLFSLLSRETKYRWTEFCFTHLNRHNLLGAVAYLKSQCKRSIRDGQKLLMESIFVLLVKIWVTSLLAELVLTLMGSTYSAICTVTEMLDKRFRINIIKATSFWTVRSGCSLSFFQMEIRIADIHHSH